MEDTTPNVPTTPFARETRRLAQRQFELYETVTGKVLDSETINADQAAWFLISSGFSLAIRQAEQAGRSLLAYHFGELLNQARRDGCYLWLHGMAIDGKGLPERGLRPIGEIIQPIVEHARRMADEA